VPWLKLVLLNTQDPLYHGYVAAGLLQVNDDAYAHREAGLAALPIGEGKVNGMSKAVCYVLYQPDEAATVYRAYFAPISAVASAQSAAAYLVAHEVGHCLDRLERTHLVGQKMAWPLDQVAAIGLAPEAIRRVFGASLAAGAYGAKERDLAHDHAQRQYEERIADAFGILWVWRLGGSEAVRDAVMAQRATLDPWDVHATAPILKALDGYKEPLAHSDGVSDIWALARKAQLAAGVDPSLGTDSPHAVDPAVDPAAATSVAVPVKPQDLAPQPRNFNDLPRFGAPTTFGE